MKYNQITYEACLPAYKRAAENARKYGMPFGITIITTPNNLDVEAGAFCYDMMSQAGRWTFECFDFNDVELLTYLKANSKNDFFFVEFSYKELGRDDAWLEEMIRQCNGNRAKIKREILLEWPKSMESSVFNEEQLDKINEFIKVPISNIYAMNKQYRIDLYEIPDVNINYILSCDVAGGLSHDNSTIVIVHPGDFHVVGDFRNNKIDTDTFKKLIEEMMKLYFPNSILVVERNSYGLNILQQFMKDPTIEPRMYREKRESLGEKKTKDGFTVKRSTDTVIYGVDTNTVTRKQMLDMLPELVECEYDKFISPNLFSDIASLERKKNGKIEHSSSGHDDSLMAYLIFRWAVFYGKCFRDRFGIHPVPTRLNVKVISSQENISKIENVILNANKFTGLETNSNFQYINELTQRAHEGQKKEEEHSETKQMNAFMRIAGFNRDD